MTRSDISPLPPYAFTELHMALCCCLHITYYIVHRSIRVCVILVSSQNPGCTEEQRNSSQVLVKEKKNRGLVFILFVGIFRDNCDVQSRPNHVGWKRHLRSPSPATTPGLPSPSINYVSKGLIDMGFEHLQGW